MTFLPGQHLREFGQHYKEMYVLEDGGVQVRLQAGNGRQETIEISAGDPVGEIGFLQGTPANSDVVAISKTTCLRVDDSVLKGLNASHPELAAQLLRSLVETLEQRQSFNLSLFGGTSLFADNSGVRVLLCRDDDMLDQAHRLRYDIYCRELERDVPSANHEKGTLADSLDNFGHTFIALDNGEVVGSIRANRSTEGDLGLLASLYGMDQSSHHPATTGIVTKLVVRKSHRKTALAMSMIAAICRYGVRHGITEIYVDTIPQLLHYYLAMGFKISNERFLHPDNGPSVPLRIDFAKYGEILGREPTKVRLVKMYLASRYYKILQKIRGQSG